MAQLKEIPTPASARGVLGQVSRRHRDEPELIEDARRSLAEAKIAEYVRKTVDSAPPLTAEQRQRLAALLTSGAA